MENSTQPEAQEVSKEKGGVDSGGEENPKSPRNIKKDKKKKSKEFSISEPRDFRVVSHIEFDKDSGALKGTGLDQLEDWTKNGTVSSPPSSEERKSSNRKSSLFNFGTLSKKDKPKRTGFEVSSPFNVAHKIHISVDSASSTGLTVGLYHFIIKFPGHSKRMGVTDQG